MNINNPIKLLWGHIRGDISNQTDLQQALALKRDETDLIFNGAVSAPSVNVSGAVTATTVDAQVAWANVTGAPSFVTEHTSGIVASYAAPYPGNPNLYDVFGSGLLWFTSKNPAGGGDVCFGCMSIVSSGTITPIYDNTFHILIGSEWKVPKGAVMDYCRLS